MAARVATAADEDKATAEAERARAEAKKLLAEAESAKAVARKEKALAAQEEIKLASAKRSEEKTLATDDSYRRYFFDSHVDSKSVKNCMDKLAEWSRRDPGKPIELVICSPGGSVIDGLALFDYIISIRNAGTRIDTHAIGYAASMGGVLLEAGETRSMGATSSILIHEISTATMGSIGAIEDEVEFIKQLQNRVLRIFANRSNGKVSVATLQRKWRRKNWWLDSVEALKLGIVDEVR